MQHNAIWKNPDAGVSFPCVGKLACTANLRDRYQTPLTEMARIVKPKGQEWVHRGRIGSLEVLQGGADPVVRW
jgi:ubiquinone/menaquinone biosynthesis C-methylase UbiE